MFNPNRASWIESCLPNMLSLSTLMKNTLHTVLTLGARFSKLTNTEHVKWAHSEQTIKLADTSRDPQHIAKPRSVWDVKKHNSERVVCGKPYAGIRTGGGLMNERKVKWGFNTTTTIHGRRWYCFSILHRCLGAGAGTAGWFTRDL